jgi:MFS family permease
VSGGDGLWRNRDYIGWLAGETLSTLGTSLSTFAYPLLILFATHSAAKTGIVAAAGNIGSLVTLLIGGALADRYSRRMLLIVGPLLQAAVVGSVALAVLAGHVVLVHIVAAGLVDGAVVGVTSGAGRAALRRLVPPPAYAGAAAQLYARDATVKVVGPPLGGVLFSISRAVPFVGDAVSYLAGVAGVLAIRRSLGPDPAETEDREPLFRAVKAGLRFLLANPYLRFVAGWAAVMNMLGSGLSLLVIFLVRARGGGAFAIGVTQAIGSVGGILGALVSGRIIRRFAGRSLAIALSWCISAAAFVMGVVPSQWGIGAPLAVVTVVVVPFNIVLETYEMQIIPDAMLGRVTTAIDLAANGLRWVAPLAVAVVVENSSAPTAAVVWGIAFVVVALFVVFNRSLHVLDRPIEQVAAPVSPAAAWLGLAARARSTVPRCSLNDAASAPS